MTANLIDYNSGNLARGVFPPSTTAQKVNSGYAITIESNGKQYTAFFRSHGEEHEKRVFGKTLDKLAKDTKIGDHVQLQIHQNVEKGHQPDYQTGNNQLTGLIKR